MQRIPVIAGTIKRRMLINFRADPEVIQPLLPRGMRPKLHGGHAIAGICLIRLEHVRPRALPALLGISSENAAHRIAVEWEEEDGSTCEGVYIPRRDTDSALNALAGGRIFPGEHHYSRFEVADRDGAIRFEMRSRDDKVFVELEAREQDSWPASSIFTSIEESSEFFRCGSVGYSDTREGCRLDGILLKTEVWQVSSLEVMKVKSSYFMDRARFPDRTIQFDHALIMRDIPHEWHGVKDYAVSEYESNPA